MCQHKSGIAVKVSEVEVKVYLLAGEDSHQKIRDHFSLNDSSALSRYQTPIEFIPVRGIDAIEQYDFRFDASCPEWWTAEMTEEAKRVLFAASQVDLKSKKFIGDLELSSLTTLPANARLTAGGDLELRSLTTLPANAKLTAGGDGGLGCEATGRV